MKKSITILFVSILIFFTKSFAQFNTEWTANYQHTTAANFSNESRKVIVDGAGNGYVLSDVTSNIDPTGNVTASTYHYTVLSKYSSTGALLVSKSINVIDHTGTGFDNTGAFGMEMDANDYIYIGFITYDPAKDFDVNISKYNTSLVRLWTRKYNPAGSDVGVDMGINGSGTVFAIVKSVTGGNTIYRTIKANSQLTNDTALYSFTANTDVFNAIAVSGTSMYVTGYTMVSGAKACYTAKLNDQGTLKWTKTFNGGTIAGDDFGSDITVGPDGNVYLTGTSDRGAPTENDVLISKIAPGGTTIWNRYRDYNNSNADAGLLINAPNMNYVYVGSQSGNSVLLDQIENGFGVAGGRTVYAPVPTATYIGLNGAHLHDLKVSVNDGFYLTGSIFATDNLGRTFCSAFLVKYLFSPPGSRDAFKLDSEMPVSGTFTNSTNGVSMALDYFKNDVYWLTDLFSDYSTHSTEKAVLKDLGMVSIIRQANTDNTTLAPGEISIEPNPSAGLFTLSAGEKITKIELFNITGKQVKTLVAASEIIKMDLSELMNGIYIGKIYSASGTITSRKIIKN
ncbi:MAG TPA: T9SS type A sorting domain-containing protein [Bacteroidia bacterium]|nr:T9SS type A sorting domain-containing protein [Bacteroidia bacterium]